MWLGMGSTPLNAKWVEINAQLLSSTKDEEQLLSSNPAQSSHYQHHEQSSSHHPGMWVLVMESIVFVHDAVPCGLQLGVKHPELW